ncbi:hypothetical protein RZS08_16550, partial [Arthrospira platensis SPKY1]|nr:hypothetical protein [Arthrospira platensis SPKY1]
GLSCQKGEEFGRGEPAVGVTKFHRKIFMGKVFVMFCPPNLSSAAVLHQFFQGRARITQGRAQKSQ